MWKCSPNWLPMPLPPTWAELLQELDKESHIHALTGARCSSVTATAVNYTDEAGGASCKLPADTVILAVGMEPNAATADSFIGAAPQVIPVGDCVNVATVEKAMKSSFYAAVRL